MTNSEQAASVYLQAIFKQKGGHPIGGGSQKKLKGYDLSINPEFAAEAEAIWNFFDEFDHSSAQGRDADSGNGQMPASDAVRVIKRNMVRTVYEATAGGDTFLLKHYHSAGLVNALKYVILPTRASTEWKVMQRFNELGIPTARPIIYGEKRRFGFLTDSFFATSFIADSISYGPFTLKLMRQGLWNDTIKTVLFSKLARLTAQLHESSIFHADFHLGNVLVSNQKSPSPDLHVIDLHAVFFPGRLKRKQVLLNLARVTESIRQLGADQVPIFLEMYLQLRPGFAPSTKSLASEVGRLVAALDRRKIKSRTKRCLMRSSRFTPARRGPYKMNLRRTVTADEVIDLISTHDSVAPSGDDRLIPPSNKNKVTALNGTCVSGPAKFCVKEYRPRSILRRLLPIPSEAKRSWIAGLGLEVRQTPTPETVAWVRGGGREFIITRFVEGAFKLHDYALRTRMELPREERTAFVDALAAEVARFVRHIHLTGVCHHDLCEQNILVAGKGPRRTLYLIDLDTVTFKRRLGSGRIVKNLVQLGHLPGDVGVLVKARFFTVYGRQTAREALRGELFKRIDEGILRRMQAKRRRYQARGDADPHPLPSALKRSWNGL